MPLDNTVRQTVIVADPMHEAGIERLRSRFDVIMPEAFSTGASFGTASAIVVRTYVVDEGVLAALPSLKIVAKHGSGTDNIDIPAASRRGIAVANSPGESNATGVAEGAVALMLAVLHRIPLQDRLVRSGRYADRWTLPLRRLWDKQLGLVGFGQIARHVAGICSGFRMQVRAFDPWVTSDAMKAAGVEKVDSLADLLRTSDIISLHAPLTEQTRGMIGEAELALMKRSAVLVNTARGALVDEAALARTLAAGLIWGAGIDVFDPEPPLPGNPLFELDNVILSPHAIASSLEGREALSIRAAILVETALSGELPPTTLNRDALLLAPAGQSGTP